MVKLVTDSSVSLPVGEVTRLGISVVPMMVLFGQTSYLDGVDLSAKEFFAKLASSSQNPTTSAPTPGGFQHQFQELTADGSEVVALLISGKLSATFSAAQVAAEALPQAKIRLVDTQSASVGLGLIVQAAARTVAEGKDSAGVVRAIEPLLDHMNLVFLFDTLEYLRRGGRIGKAQAFVGTLLNVKPILELRQGEVQPLERARSRRKGMARLVDIVSERLGGNAARAHINVGHGEAEADAHELADTLRERFGCLPPEISEIGPVLGTHTGPGALGLAFYVD